MKFDCEQMDIICTISVVLKKVPYTYNQCGVSVFWDSIDGVLIVDFEKREMQFTDWKHTQDEIYFQLLGVCHVFSLKSEDYITK